jgi:tRNA-intron lyase
MPLEIEFNQKTKSLSCTEASSVGSLTNGYYGLMEKGRINLFDEEALYLIDIRNARCLDENKNELSFNSVCKMLKKDRLLIRYFTYAAWRDRGLIILPASTLSKSYNLSSIKTYPSKRLILANMSCNATFYEDDLYSIIDDVDAAREIYENGWFGQFGTYKAEQRGRLGKLDIYETLFLIKNAGLRVENSTEGKVLKAANSRRPDFKTLYNIYEDFRLNGYILKTGFKFGTHFRIYLPEAGPKKGKKWVHSQHVLHVFPRSCKLLISEWSRAIRLAHSVRKTFVLAINGQKKRSIKSKKTTKTYLDFVCFHRKGQDIENPKTGKPKYLMLSLSEEDYLSGAQLAKAIDECKQEGLELLLAIVDRESSVTFYAVKRIDIPGSDYEYYEIEWVLP